NEGVQVQLLSGPKDFDALAGLGLKPQLLVNDSTTNQSADDKTPKADSGKQTIGLGLNVGLDLLSKSTAAHAHVVLIGAESLVRQAYARLTGSGQSTTQTPTGPAPAYLQSQLANYQTALAWLSSSG